MTAAARDPGSFRDPGGRVFLDGPRVLRTVMPSSAEAYAAVRDAGLLGRLAERGMLLSSAEVDPAVLGGVEPAAAYVLEHPRVPFISYPYEWTFALHRRAALLQLDLHLELLKSGFTLSDATAYNVQFVGTRPVFIDHLSIRPYRDGEFWAGHRQFCQQYLNPLLMWTKLGVQPNAWFRGSLEGIAPEDLAPLLSWKQKLSWTVLTHVAAQAALQKRAVRSGGGTVPQSRLPLNGLKAMLEGLRHYIAGLKLKDQVTVWSDYAGQNSYAAEEAQAKRAFVGEAVAAVKPAMLLDLGCNTGDYSEVALAAGAGYVVGFDYDFGALEQAYSRFDADKRPFLPLWLDAANPSPAQGWAQQERMGLAQRASADFLVALAFIHHIVIGRNVPLGMALDWLMGMAPQGIIEFPPKEDAMVQRLLASREDIFPDYSVEAFMQELERRARVVRSVRLSENGRVLVWYERT
jgi:ribosomal protein L11 methylase PrmA